MKNSKIFFGKNSIRFWYLRYKDTPYFSLLLLVLALVVCIMIIFRVITPQVQNWFSLRREAEETRKRIAIIEDNIGFIGNMDKQNLNSQFDLALEALPSEKDFGVIIDALNDSALKSGVSLEDYSFQVGNIASGSAGSKDAMMTVKISLLVRSSLTKAQQFIKEIQERIPLAEIQGVDGSSDAYAINLQFYQKQFPVVQIRDEELIDRVSQRNLSLLKSLEAWQQKMPPPDFLPVDDSTESGVMPLF